jgi:DNA-binding response OmpR family regulator
MKKITIVDDDPDLRNILQVVLRSNEYAVEVFQSGEDFLKRYTGTSDLFIIDINLGGISGIEICNNLKQQAATKDVPVIIISAHPEIEKLAKEVCADDSLTKPFTQNSLLRLVLRYLPV